jgi:2-oxoisovalerate dehydrogenase E1 component
MSTEKKWKKTDLLDLYRALVLPRHIEEKMLKLLRQNRVSKWFSGIGQEAIAVGATKALSEDDFVLPMHRNLGVFTSRNVPLYDLFCQLSGKADGITGGRERSFHFGMHQYRIIGMISHLAAMMPVADGIALAAKLRGEKTVALSFCGDGATSEGEFHEALNLAAVWKLPVIFLIENNGYGLSTPTNEQYACQALVDKAIGYGLKGMRIDGNDILEVHKAVSEAKKLALNGEPVFIEALTFRMRGHEEASGTDYVPKSLMDEWAKKDPILRFKNHLLGKAGVKEAELDAIDRESEHIFLDDLEKALQSPEPVFDASKQLNRVFAPVVLPAKAASGEMADRRYIDGITTALDTAFTQDSSFVLMGQDVAEYGGVFKVTQGFVQKFGKSRIRNTPIIEAGAIGAALGLAYNGMKGVVEMQFADFISCGFNQIVNNVAKSHYRWSDPVNVTIRAPYGGGVGAGPFHSQCPEGWFMQHAGIKIVCPATVEDAQVLLYSALLDPNPVLVMEHKKLYRSLKAVVPAVPVAEEIGKAAIRRNGTHATIITYGMGVHWALEAAESYAKKDVDLEVLDLRSLVPIDLATIRNSIKKTGRALLLQEPSEMMGPMSEIGSLIGEHCFELLDAPVLRCSSLDMPVPFSPALESGYLATARLHNRIDTLLAY